MTISRSPIPTAGPGHQIYAFKSFWPAPLVDVSQTGGSVIIPDQLWLIEGDRIMIQIGDLPALPVVVYAVNRDCVGFHFVDEVHPTVVRAITGPEAYGNCAAGLTDLSCAA